jgi:hypothetical protein
MNGWGGADFNGVNQCGLPYHHGHVIGSSQYHKYLMFHVLYLQAKKWKYKIQLYLIETISTSAEVSPLNYL